MRTLFTFISIVAGLLASLWLAIALWGAFSPVVLLHYSADAGDRLLYFFNDNDDTTKAYIAPGETVRLRTAMVPKPNMWILLSFPRENGDSLEITKPFSRIDVYIGPGAKIERTEIHQEFFARF